MPPVVMWFRRDLRLRDNPALDYAVNNARQVIPVYIYAPDDEKPWPPGAASRWWLHHSLVALDEALARAGSRLILRNGASMDELEKLIRQTGARQVVWNRVYEPAWLKLDRSIQKRLEERHITTRVWDANLLIPPDTVLTQSGTPYKVFTPFWRACLKQGLPSRLYAAPKKLPPPPEAVRGLSVDQLHLLPSVPWDTGFYDMWTPGEDGAHQKWESFCDDGLVHYARERDIPSKPSTSGLSPHLHFGEISPHYLLHRLDAEDQARKNKQQAHATEKFVAELGWREFATYILFHFPTITHQPLDRRFERFPWQKRVTKILKAWQQGKTGIPLVDAGMRELWHTGYMHNRVRMIVASFLTKNAGIHWLQGARWFWDTLVDADLASNSFNWQWVAGCGADAAPYFRIFNPVKQAEKFDSDGLYIKKWVPELEKLNRDVHYPSSAIAKKGHTAPGLTLGKDYPEPVLDLSASRQRALQWYQQFVKNR